MIRKVETGTINRERRKKNDIRSRSRSNNPQQANPLKMTKKNGDTS